MAGLTDMEELLGRVSNPEINSYLREAYTCYGAGAYRACIVLTANALFQDLRQKTKAVSSINADAKAISEEIETFAEQKAFETTLVERLVSKSILSKVQGDRLKQITAHRNKAAHPSGIHASAEEARWVFFEAIDKYLSKSVLSTNQIVDHLMARLGDENYFPNISITNIANITREEVEHLHPLAFPYLIVKLVNLMESDDATKKKNGRFFLSGCAKMQNDDLRGAIINNFLRTKASNTKFKDSIMVVISADPILIKKIEPTTKHRLNTLFEKAVSEIPSSLDPTSLRHPVSVLKNLVAHLNQDEILPDLEKFVDATVGKYYADPGIVEALNKPGAVREKVLEALLERAGSNDFDEANKFAKSAPDFDDGLADKLNDKEALRIISAITRAAECGAFSARSLRNNKFNSLPNLRAKAFKCLTHKPSASDSILKAARLSLTATEFITEHLGDDSGL